MTPQGICGDGGIRENVKQGKDCSEDSVEGCLSGPPWDATVFIGERLLFNRELFSEAWEETRGAPKGWTVGANAPFWSRKDRAGQRVVPAGSPAPTEAPRGGRQGFVRDPAKSEEDSRRAAFMEASAGTQASGVRPGGPDPGAKQLRAKAALGLLGQPHCGAGGAPLLTAQCLRPARASAWRSGRSAP